MATQWRFKRESIGDYRQLASGPPSLERFQPPHHPTVRARDAAPSPIPCERHPVIAFTSPASHGPFAGLFVRVVLIAVAIPWYRIQVGCDVALAPSEPGVPCHPDPGSVRPRPKGRA